MPTMYAPCGAASLARILVGARRCGVVPRRPLLLLLLSVTVAVTLLLVVVVLAPSSAAAGRSRCARPRPAAPHGLPDRARMRVC